MQNATIFAGVDAEVLQARGFRERMQRHLLRLAAAMLGHDQRDRTGLGLLQRQLHFDFIRLHRLPIRLELLAVCVLDHDALHATDTARLQMHGVFAADDQRAVVRARQLPLLRVRIHQLEARPGVFLEAPEAMQRALNAIAQTGAGQARRRHDEATLLWIGLGGQVDRVAVLA